MTQRILVVDDDETIQRTLRINLRARDLEVITARDGRTAVQAMEERPDVVILDLGLPDIEGIEVLRRIRATSRIPVIVLSARHESDDKVEALDEGADDYVTKPFGMDELMARLRVALRRADELPATDPVVTSDFQLAFDTHVAHAMGDVVHLTPTEWRMLAVLARHRGRVVPHETILKEVWGPSYGHEANYLRVYANQIRRKIEPDPREPRYLITEAGVGYTLKVP